ncbi:uncharacterized protein LOC121241918 [Juglans microcarpa x Juglans regia]|uniref:uncharacterized protein LOC121241918 n=1 Tax=Juglans microcarpa x Juglans regia TaxID=2249226 RepID=UPI001B7E125E|nr:uncharacterized protein LOC121241918 [Juglans microcarpa x Juglans regia]
MRRNLISISKLDESGYFIGYPDRSKGYKFYCPNRGTRIVESITAKFLENDVGVSGSSVLKELFADPNPVVVPVPVVQERAVSLPIEIVSEEPEQQEEIPTIVESFSEPQVRRSQRERR